MPTAAELYKEQVAFMTLKQINQELDKIIKSEKERISRITTSCMHIDIASPYIKELAYKKFALENNLFCRL